MNSRYFNFKALKLTELCNECEAIMAGKLQYGSVCKRCQKKYDEAIKLQISGAASSIKADASGIFDRIKCWFS